MAGLLQMPSNLNSPESWEAAIRAAGSDQELLEAITYFRPVLGEEWGGWQRKAHLARVFHTSYQSAPREWTRLYRLILALDRVPNVDLVVRQGLGSVDWTQYVAAVQALEFCGRFRGAGRDVQFVKTGNDKAPDARVTLLQRPVAVEFKALHEPDRQKPWDELSAYVTDQLALRQSSLSSLELEYAEEALRHPDLVVEGIVAAREARDPKFRPMPGGTGRVRWNDALGDMGRWRLPFEQADDLSRIVDKLRSKWWKQVQAEDAPTLIAVRSGTVFFFETDQGVGAAPEVTDVLRDAMRDRPMVGALLLSEEPLWGPPEPLVLATPNFRFVSGASDGGHSRTAMLVTNPAANIPLEKEEADVLVGKEMLW